MPRSKQLPPARVAPEPVDVYEDGDFMVTVYEDFTPEKGRQPTSKGGWGRFSGVGEKGTAVRGGSAPEPV